MLTASAHIFGARVAVVVISSVKALAAAVADLLVKLTQQHVVVITAIVLDVPVIVAFAVVAEARHFFAVQIRVDAMPAHAVAQARQLVAALAAAAQEPLYTVVDAVPQVAVVAAAVAAVRAQFVVTDVMELLTLAAVARSALVVCAVVVAAASAHVRQVVRLVLEVVTVVVAAAEVILVVRRRVLMVTC